MIFLFPVFSCFFFFLEYRLYLEIMMKTSLALSFLSEIGVMPGNSLHMFTSISKSKS